jgi:hypothetical protein
MSDDTPSNDRIGALRSLPAVEEAVLPATPSAYQTLTALDQSKLRRVAKDHEAEVRQALEQFASRGDKVREDLGNNAPDPKRATALALRMKNNKGARAKLEALLSYLNDDNVVVLNDAVILLEDIRDLAEPNLKKNAALANQYSETFEYFQGVGQKISEGMARKKKEPKK